MAGSGDPIRVVLVDDHELFRTGLRDLLDDPGIEVVADAADGAQGIELTVEHAPDVVVMDLHMPGMSGVDATRALATRAPASRVLVLTVSSNDEDVMDAMLAGACGYMLKDASTDELVAAIRAAAAGEHTISPKIAARLLARLRDAQSTAARSSGTARAELTQRELEVLRLLSEGKPNAEIAGELFITPKTVTNHVASILAKLQMESRLQAAVYALKSGIV